MPSRTCTDIYLHLFTFFKEDDNILYVGGTNALIYAFSITSHEIIDIEGFDLDLLIIKRKDDASPIDVWIVMKCNKV